MNLQDETADLVTVEIVRTSALPLEDATTLPPDAYRSEALLAREVDRIFRREWLFAGRVDEIPNEGDYFSFEIAGEPLLVLRGYDGQLGYLGLNVSDPNAWLELMTKVFALEVRERKGKDSPLEFRVDDHHHRLALYPAKSDGCNTSDGKSRAWMSCGTWPSI